MLTVQAAKILFLLQSGQMIMLRPRHLFHKPYTEGKGREEGQDISKRLGFFNTLKAPYAGQDKKGRDKKDTAS